MESHTPIYIFNFLAAGGFGLLLATLIPAMLSRSIHRSKTWFSMIISWIIYALSYLLIVGHQLGPEPPRAGVCVLQMVFIYASPPLTAISGLAFILDTHFRITKALFTRGVDHKYTRILLLVPWVSFAVVAGEALIVVQDFADIQRNSTHMYCHSSANVQYLTTALICVISLGTALCMIAWTAVILYRNWALFRQLSANSERELRLSSLIRIMIFTMMASIGLGLGAFATTPDVASSAIWSALLPILPFLCGIAFGTQKDIIRCWMFWKPKVNHPDSSTSSSNHPKVQEEV
ncbi:hypothetical protein B0H17DRAFT_525254 [Mycena rosella]|uniref:Uncharacterized protein n=1 Tax=Mycena rosella TaxID=1033263 RepID=A0AAD7GXT1_MYCRO|nr:hypothetical protein B0H17DRAFT_525254 [Mycena rosella]